MRRHIIIAGIIRPTPTSIIIRQKVWAGTPIIIYRSEEITKHMQARDAQATLNESQRSSRFMYLSKSPSIVIVYQISFAKGK